MQQQTAKVMGCSKKTKTDGLLTDTHTQSTMEKYHKECLFVTSVITHHVLIQNIFGLETTQRT